MWSAVASLGRGLLPTLGNVLGSIGNSMISNLASGKTVAHTISDMGQTASTKMQEEISQYTQQIPKKLKSLKRQNQIQDAEIDDIYKKIKTIDPDTNRINVNDIQLQDPNEEDY